MKEIINFCKKKYKVLIPVMVGIVLLVALFFLYREYEYENTRIKKEIAVFQTFFGERTDYKAIVTYNLKDSILDLNAKDLKVYYDSTPIYYMNLDRVIFPMEMSVVFPRLGGEQYKTYKYSTYYNKDDIHYIRNNINEEEYRYFFMYDGKGLFFFPDEVTLMLDDEEYIKLSPMSYAEIVGGVTLIYYDIATDHGEMIELEGRKVTVTSDYIKVNLSEKNFMALNYKTLLMHPNNLDALPKTIDK